MHSELKHILRLLNNIVTNYFNYSKGSYAFEISDNSKIDSLKTTCIEINIKNSAELDKEWINLLIKDPPYLNIPQSKSYLFYFGTINQFNSNISKDLHLFDNIQLKSNDDLFKISMIYALKTI
jgi:hypothetical protein